MSDFRVDEFRAAGGTLWINGIAIPVQHATVTTTAPDCTITIGAPRPEPSPEDRAMISRLASYRPLWKRRLGIAR